MTTLTWIAGNPGNWFTAANWSTNSTPQIGDTMIVASGTAIISADPHPTIGGESIVLGGANAGATVTLQAIDTTFTASPSDIATTITVSGGDGPSALHATLLVEGASFLQDQIFVQAAGGKLTIDSESDGSTPGNFTITNATDESLILVSHESFLDLTGQTITNRGTIEIDGAARVDAGATLAGDGFVVLQGGGHLAVAGTVGTDQTVDFEDATGLLTITSGSQFDGWIELTVAGARIDLTGVAAQSRGYDTQTDTLTLYAGPNQSGAVLAQLHVTGETDLATHDFTLSGDGTGGTLVTYAPGGATTLAQANPVPVVAAAGTMVSLASILAQSFGTANPGFYGLTLREAPGAAKSGKDVGYWVEGAGAVTPVWYVNGQPMAGKEYKVQPGDDVQLLAGNAIKPIEIKAQVTPAATGDTAEFVTYDIYTVDPAVAAKLAGPPTSAGEVASAETYAAAFGHVPNTNFCYVIAENVAAGNGAAMSSHWDWSLVPTLNTTGGFWRIVYNGSQAQTPVANWSTLVQPGDIVGMDWLGDDSSGPVELQGGHVTSVLAGGGPGNTAPIKVFDNVFGDGAEIGIHNVTYWTETDPSTIIIWRLDPHQQYLIQGSGLGEFIQGSVHNNLIQPGGGADSITAGLGNNEIQDTLAHLNGIALTDFHLGDTFDFTDLAPLNTTVSYAGGAMHVFKNNRPVADVAMPGLGAGQTFAVASDGGGGSRIGITLATSLMQAQFSASLGPNIDPTTQAGILSFLHAQGFYLNASSTAAVQQSVAPYVDPFADIAEFSATSFVPVTTATSLSAVIATGLNVSVQLQGSVSVLLAAGSGNDVLNLADSGADSVLAGAGDDLILTGGQDTVRAGDGNDAIYLGLNGPASGSQAFGEAGNDVVADLGNGNNTLDGGSGDDHLYAGGSGIDSLAGGDGNDVLTGAGSGRVVLDGGSGDDVSYLTGSGNDSAFGDDGNDIFLGSGTGNYLMDGGAGDDRLYAIGDGNNTLSGDTGADSLYAAGGGTDSLDGGDDQDTLMGAGAGTYTLDGGNGNDLIYAQGSGPETVSGDAGNDIILGSGGGAYSLAGGDGDDRIYATGSGNDTLAGGDGNDFMSTGTGTNALDGGAGDDTLFYSSNSGSNDTLDGGSDNDIVVFQGKLQSNIATESTAGSVTTLVFGSGQTVFVSNIETLRFQDGSEQHPPFPTIT